eukprot:gene33440-40457_t
MFSSSKNNSKQPANSPSRWLPSFGQSKKTPNAPPLQTDAQSPLLVQQQQVALHPTTPGRRASVTKPLSGRGLERPDDSNIPNTSEDDNLGASSAPQYVLSAREDGEKGMLKQKLLRARLRECAEGGGGSLSLHSLELSELDGSSTFLGHIRSLSVKKNSFQSVGSLLQCRFLEKLDLSYNPLLGSAAESLRGLGSLQLLRSLDLSGCSLSILPEELRELPRLEELFLRRNLLEELPDWLLELHNLYLLDLSSNRLSSVPSCLQGMVGLQILRLEGNACVEAVESDSKVAHLLHKMKILCSKAERRSLVARAGVVRGQIVEAEKKWVVSHTVGTSEHPFH